MIILHLAWDYIEHVTWHAMSVIFHDEILLCQHPAILYDEVQILSTLLP